MKKLFLTDTCPFRCRFYLCRQQQQFYRNRTLGGMYRHTSRFQQYHRELWGRHPERRQ